MRTPHRKPGKFSQLKRDPLLTEAKFIELKNKLEALKKISQPRAVVEVARLAEMGDFSENTGYQFAKGRLRGINQTILDLANQLKEAIIIAPQKQANTVQLGQKVTIENDNEQKTYQIFGSSETNPQKGIISHRSPLGAALLGRKVGELVKVKLANKEVEYRIMKTE